MHAKHQTVCSYAPVQRLYEAARSMVKRDNAHSRARLVAAINALERVAEISDKLLHVRELARQAYVDSSCDIDIDEANLTHHNGDDGYWVGAWLWVSDEEAQQANDDENEESEAG